MSPPEPEPDAGDTVTITTSRWSFFRFRARAVRAALGRVPATTWVIMGLLAILVVQNASAVLPRPPVWVLDHVVWPEGAVKAGQDVRAELPGTLAVELAKEAADIEAGKSLMEAQHAMGVAYRKSGNDVYNERCASFLNVIAEGEFEHDGKGNDTARGKQQRREYADTLRKISRGLNGHNL
jgi:hypothetical protein